MRIQHRIRYSLCSKSLLEAAIQMAIPVENAEICSDGVPQQAWWGAEVSWGMVRESSDPGRVSGSWPSKGGPGVRITLQFWNVPRSGGRGEQNILGYGENRGHSGGLGSSEVMKMTLQTM